MTTTLWKRITEASPKNGNGNAYDVEVWAAERGRREFFLQQFGFAVPTIGAVRAIKRFAGAQKILEIGAGPGTWARLLSSEGATIVAIDDWSGDGKYASQFKVGAHFPVKREDATDAVRRYRTHEILMTCWPDYSNSMAASAIKAFRGDRLVYIGEGDGGCTADDRFHKILAKHWQEVESIWIPQWPGLHDELVFYERIVDGP